MIDWSDEQLLGFAASMNARAQVQAVDERSRARGAALVDELTRGEYGRKVTYWSTFNDVAIQRTKENGKAWLMTTYESQRAPTYPEDLQYRGSVAKVEISHTEYLGGLLKGGTYENLLRADGSLVGVILGEPDYSTEASLMIGARLPTRPGGTLRSLGVAGERASLSAAPSSNGLVHLTSGKAGALINESGVLRGNIYAGPLSNAGQSGLGVTLRTGLSPGAYEAAVRIPSAGEAAFSSVRPIGPMTTWQWATGQQYTANGVLNLSTGAFTRTGVNWNQALIYGTDAAITVGTGYGIYRTATSQSSGGGH